MYRPFPRARKGTSGPAMALLETVASISQERFKAWTDDETEHRLPHRVRFQKHLHKSIPQPPCVV
jgi:hypothetical protein